MTSLRPGAKALFNHGTADATRAGFRADAAEYVRRYAASKHTADALDRG